MYGRTTSKDSEFRAEVEFGDDVGGVVLEDEVGFCRVVMVVTVIFDWFRSLKICSWIAQVVHVQLSFMSAYTILFQGVVGGAYRIHTPNNNPPLINFLYPRKSTIMS